MYLCNMLFKTSFLLPHLLCNVDFKLIRLIEFQNKTNIEIIGLQLVMEISPSINAFWILFTFVKYRFVRYRFVRY